MKIDARSAARTLEQAGKWRAIVLYGDDHGLIRERAQAAVRVVAESLDDAFRVVALEREQHVRLEEETQALSLIGGRRVVWLRDGSDAIVPMLKRVLDQDSDTLIVVEAPGLMSRAKLRVLADQAASIASIGCYPEEGRNLSASVTAMLSERRVRIDRDALDWLTGRLSPDRAMVRAEIEKLVLYAGEGGTLDLDAVTEIVADAGAASLDDAIWGALSGDRAGADRALERALADGVNPVAVARALLGALGRLQRVRAGMDMGQSRGDAIKALRPPVFFKRLAAFERALERWSAAALLRALRRTQAFELACKQTGAADMALCRRHIAEIAAARRSA